MYEVDQLFESDTEVKQSKFLAFVLPIGKLDEELELLRSLHPKARHFIVAWRKMNEYEQVVEYSTDDGEPKGTSGRPVLNVLRGENLINSAVIIVRYFGGTKLGTGGLVRAYSDAVKQVLKSAILLPFEVRKPLTATVSYSYNPRFEHYIAEHSLRVVKTDFTSNEVLYTLTLTKQERKDIEVYETSQHIIKIYK